MAAFISGRPLTRRLVGTEKHYLNKSCFLSLTQQWYFSPRRGIKLLPPSLGLQDQLRASLVEAAEGHHLQPASPTATPQEIFRWDRLVLQSASMSNCRGFGFSAQAALRARLRIASGPNHWKTEHFPPFHAMGSSKTSRKVRAHFLNKKHGSWLTLQYAHTLKTPLTARSSREQDS